MDEKDKDQAQQPATGQECSGKTTPETGKPAGYIEEKTCGKANCFGDFRCEAVRDGRPVTSNYDDLNVKGVIENLVRFGFVLVKT